MRPRDARGRFLKTETVTPPRPWTIYATSRTGHQGRIVNRHRHRLFSRVPSTQVRFESQTEAEDYLARFPVTDYPRWLFTATTL